MGQGSFGAGLSIFHVCHETVFFNRFYFNMAFDFIQHFFRDIRLLFWSLWFLKRNNRLMFISFAVLVGIFHRPTFFIFGLSYIIFVLCRVIFVKKEDGKNRWIKEIIDGLIILDLSLVFYIGFIEEAILPLIYPVAASFISPGNSSGTFVSFFSYQFSTLAYLPLSIVGFLYLLKKKEFNMLFFWTVINVLIVYFQF